MLTPDKVRYANGVKVCEKLMPDGLRATKNIATWVKKGGLMKPNISMQPIGITIHNTSDLRNVNEDAEQYTRATYNQNMAGVVVHYYVDDINAWQLLREDEPGWHASDGNGNGNRKTIAIECIMDGTGSAEDLGARDNAARLAAHILKEHNWDINDVYTHNHWKKLPDTIVPGASKNCPKYLLPDWDGFKRLIQKYLNNQAPAVSQPISTTPSNTSTAQGIKVGDIMNFTGTHQYKSSSSTAALSAKSSRVKVTSITKKASAHPIHVRSVDDHNKFLSRPTVYGWVNAEDLEKATPYHVRTNEPDLNIRSGPGILYKVVSTIKKRGVYTIIEEKNGWGRLKSKVGWINLKYTTKL